MANTDHSKEKAAKVARGDELVTVLKEVLEDNARILQNQETIMADLAEVRDSIRKVLPRKEPHVRC
ncbi:MAG: hypothetical protein MJY87_02455 [Fibrobacter sp.]|nr:hypothetical protein [Fibrobacter sp.]